MMGFEASHTLTEDDPGQFLAGLHKRKLAEKGVTLLGLEFVATCGWSFVFFFFDLGY
jgi:hypothetical protein